MAPIFTDAHLVQIVNAALADATARGGAHLACRPGCFQCCVGAFAINVLDAERLRRGWAELAGRDGLRAARVEERVRDYVARTAASFPGDTATGAIDESPEGQARFEEFANDEVCPVLDPETGTCDLYVHRPMTCRVFGPPVRLQAPVESGVDDAELDTGYGICELCFVDASPEEIKAAELRPDPDDLEGRLLAERLRDGAKPGSTTVAYALSTCRLE